MIKVNKAGNIYILLTILIGFSAVNTGNNLIYIIASALLSYMLVSGIFGRNNIYGMDVSLEFPEEMFAHTDTPVAVRARNQRKFLPAFLIRVMIGSQEVFYPFIKAREETGSHMNMRFDRRGRHTLTDITVASVFPFNFFTRYRKIGKKFDLIIFPKPEKIPLNLPFDRPSRSRGDALSDSVGFDADVVSIRDYVSGDALKTISWKSTAKTGQLKTKELSSIELHNVMIDFDRMDKRNLEHTLSCATFLVIRLTRSNIPVGMVIDGQFMEPSTSPTHRLMLLKKLALYGQE